MTKILSVVGARPNFMKVAPLHRAFVAHGGFDSRIVHTGQHYDERMSDIFFRQLELPEPDRYLGVGSGSHAQQTARVMTEFEKVMFQEKPDLVLVVGDVNSTLACSIAAKKLHAPVVHVEAGLRSGDRTMPEEINRIVTDSISDYLFVTEQSGMDNLRKEGVPDDRVFLVGNVMIDSLVRYIDAAKSTDVIERLGVENGSYVLVTMHRPANVDNPTGLQIIAEIVAGVSEKSPVVFPVHPRTRGRLEADGLLEVLDSNPDVHILEPVGYLEFVALMAGAGVVVTDSGGIQEETTYLHIPCLTLRPNTERPVTIELGTNELLPLNTDIVRDRVTASLSGSGKKGSIPPLWDGLAAQRIVATLSDLVEMRSLVAYA